LVIENAGRSSWLLFRRGLAVAAQGGHNDFAAQFALAVSFAGRMFAYGVFAVRGSQIRGAWLVLALHQAVLLAGMPNAIHRLWSGSRRPPGDRSCAPAGRNSRPALLLERSRPG
jgi:hypothetical protein